MIINSLTPEQENALKRLLSDLKPDPSNTKNEMYYPHLQHALDSAEAAQKLSEDLYDLIYASMGMVADRDYCDSIMKLVYTPDKLQELREELKELEDNLARAARAFEEFAEKL